MKLPTVTIEALLLASLWVKRKWCSAAIHWPFGVCDGRLFGRWLTSPMVQHMPLLATWCTRSEDCGSYPGALVKSDRCIPIWFPMMLISLCSLIQSAFLLSKLPFFRWWLCNKKVLKSALDGSIATSKKMPKAWKTGRIFGIFLGASGLKINLNGCRKE